MAQPGTRQPHPQVTFFSSHRASLCPRSRSRLIARACRRRGDVPARKRCGALNAATTFSRQLQQAVQHRGKGDGRCSARTTGGLGLTLQLHLLTISSTSSMSDRASLNAQPLASVREHMHAAAPAGCGGPAVRSAAAARSRQERSRCARGGGLSAAPTFVPPSCGSHRQLERTAWLRQRTLPINSSSRESRGTCMIK